MFDRVSHNDNGTKIGRVLLLWCRDDPVIFSIVIDG
jgi:hypothetical protein